MIGNSSLLDGLETMLTESHSCEMGNLMKTCSEYYRLTEKLRTQEKEIVRLLGNDYFSEIKRYVVLSREKAYFEQRYMYIKGMKAIIRINSYLSNEGMDKHLLEYEQNLEHYEL